MTVDLEAMETRSRELLSAARTVLPGGGLGQNNLPPELSFVVARGEGARLVDLCGRTYLDYVLGSGPLLLGHAHPAPVQAVQEQAARGSTSPSRIPTPTSTGPSTRWRRRSVPSPDTSGCGGGSDPGRCVARTRL